MDRSSSTELSDITIRAAILNDIPEILRQRRRMYEDMRYTDHAAIEAMCPASTLYLQKSLSDGSFRAWLACSGDQTVPA